MKNRSNGLHSKTPFRLSLLGLLLILLALTPALTYGQGMRYLDLLRQKRQQQVFIDQLALPTAQPDDVELVTVIKIHYPFLSFKKNSGNYNQNGPKSFYAPAGFNVELFNIPEGEKPPKKREDLMELNMTKYKSAARTAWQDTAFAPSYEATQDKEKYLVGYSKTTVPAGSYYYLFSLNRPDSNTPATPMRKHMNLTASNKLGHAGFVFLDDAKDSSNGLPLMLMGNSVHYGKDFHLMVNLPEYDESESYRLKITRLEVSKDDTTSQRTVYDEEIPAESITAPSLLDVRKSNGELLVQAKKNANGYHFVNLKVPNSTFPNAYYRINLMKKGSDKPLGTAVYQSKWVDIPVSLLNVDVAIEMLHFILPKEKVDKMLKGNQKEKEKAFNDFWSDKDPTPDTQFNELMAEYYSRIDYAFREFSSPNQPGFQTDQGKVYISYGPPQNIERKFPTNSPAIEIWEYPNRTFRFQATSGFGDFKLIKQQSTK